MVSAERPGKPEPAAVSDTVRTLARLRFDIVGIFPLLRPAIREHNPSSPSILGHPLGGHESARTPLAFKVTSVDFDRWLPGLPAQGGSGRRSATGSSSKRVTTRKGGFTLHRRRAWRDAGLQRCDTAGGEVAAPQANSIAVPGRPPDRPPARPCRSTASASSTPGSDRQLDRDRAAASFREGETACLSPTAIGAKLSPSSLRRSPDCFKRIRSRGRKRAAKGSCH